MSFRYVWLFLHWLSLILFSTDRFSWEASFSAQDKSGRQGFLHFGMRADTAWPDMSWKNDRVSTRRRQFAACFDLIQDDLKCVHVKNTRVHRFNGSDSRWLLKLPAGPSTSAFEPWIHHLFSCRSTSHAVLHAARIRKCSKVWIIW